MFNSNDILTRLQAGETSAQIATEMAAALNEAIAKRDAAEAAARAADQERENKLNKLATRIADDITQYVILCDPIIGDMLEGETLDIADVRESLDRLIPVLSNAARLAARFGDCPKEPNIKPDPETVNKNIDPIEEFLRKNKLL